jgi:PAS domain-containing protein
VVANLSDATARGNTRLIQKSNWNFAGSQRDSSDEVSNEINGIFILDAETGRVNDVNPFLTKLPGFSHSEMVGKTVGELSPFQDIVFDQERSQKVGYVRPAAGNG